MKRMILISMVVFLAACSSNPAIKENSATLEENSTSFEDNMFTMSMNMACKMKYGNKERCDCNTEVLFNAATPELRKGYIRNPHGNQQEILSLMLQNSDKLKACKAEYSEKSTN